MTRLAPLCLTVLLLPVVARGQAEVQSPGDLLQLGCLHGEQETAPQARRRDEALGAVRLIQMVVDRSGPRPGEVFPRWESFSDSAVVAGLQRMEGTAGELARKIRWGESEPLPGWGIAYVATPLVVRFALTDLDDPCGFTYSSVDPDVIPRRQPRVVPLH